MSAKRFIKFLADNDIDLAINENTQQLIAWIEHYHLQDFAKAISAFLRTNEATITLNPMGTIKVYLASICDFYGISPEQLLTERSKVVVPDLIISKEQL